MSDPKGNELFHINRIDDDYGDIEYEVANFTGQRLTIDEACVGAKKFADKVCDLLNTRAQHAVDAAVDNRPDNTGLDDGPPLSKRNIMAWKIPLILKAWQAGVSGRVIAEIFDVSHETVYSKMAGVERNKAQSPVEQPPQAIIQPTDNYDGGGTYEARYPVPDNPVQDADAVIKGSDLYGANNECKSRDGGQPPQTVASALERLRQNGSLLPQRLQSQHWQDTETLKAALTRHEGA